MTSSTKQRKQKGAGHVRTRTLKDGSTVYDILIKDDAGKQGVLKGGIRDPQQVEAYLAAYYANRARAQLRIPDDTGIVTVRQLGIDYLDAILARTRKTSEKRWRARVLTADFIDWPLTQLSETAVRRWINTMARAEIQVGKSAGKRPTRGTLSTALAVLRSALKYAVILELIDRNVAKAVTIDESTMAAPKGTVAGDGFEYLFEAEVKRILTSKVLSDVARTAFVMLAFTGARPMDLYLLDWAQVDVVGATVRYWSHKRSRYYVVHLLPQALSVLRTWWVKGGQPKTGLVFPGPQGRPHADGYDWGWADTRGRRTQVWYNDDTKHRELSASTRPAKGALTGQEAKRLRRLHGARQERKSELKVRSGWRTKMGIERNVPLYSLRHTCASHLLLGTPLYSGGRRWSMEEVASQLGHADLSTVRRYCVALGIMSLGAVEASRVKLAEKKADEDAGR